MTRVTMLFLMASRGTIEGLGANAPEPFQWLSQSDVRLEVPDSPRITAAEYSGRATEVAVTGASRLISLNSAKNLAFSASTIAQETRTVPDKAFRKLSPILSHA